jgi:transposase
MEESIDIPDLDDVQDLATAKFLLKYVVKALDAQTRTIEALTQEIAELKRALFGKKSERVVPIEREIRQKEREQETPEQRAERLEAQKLRREQAREKRRETAEKTVIEHLAPPICEQCGLSLEEADELADDVSEEYEYVPPKVVRREHRRQRKVCTCGCFAIGAAPVRVVEGGVYGPGLHAHVVVAKCCDSIPLDRQARSFARSGVLLSKSTLCDMFHRSANFLTPLSRRILELIAAVTYVNADETSLRVLQKNECRRGFVWDFIAKDDAGHTMVAYRFSPDRSGQTPMEVLGNSTGFLQVDGYTGYNQVTTPKKRKRAGCWSHGRRKFFDAIATKPAEAHFAIDLIREIYEVEYVAAEKSILGTEKHRALRTTQSRAKVVELMEWAEAEKPKHNPQGPLGKALKYLLNQRATLERFLDDPKIRLDNNIAEQHLRLIALGRKNFLFVGHDEAGRNLAVLQTLVSTCLANGKNPQAYLTDVLIQIQTHPHSRIDELLPWNWRAPPQTD